MKGRALVIFVQFMTVIFGDQCPTGFLWHEEDSKCCRPIPYCVPGYQVKPCTNNEFDECVPCPKGQTSSFNTSSFDMKTCKPDSCPSDRIRDKKNNCVCKLIEGYYGENPNLCNNFGERCPKGKELKINGECKLCDYGYYKDWEGYGFCKKQINCDLLQLKYKEFGNSQTAAICQEQQKDSEDSDDKNQRTEIVQSSRRDMTEIAEPQYMLELQSTFEPQYKSKLQSIFDQDLKSEPSKTKNSLFNCNFQIIVVILGTLLFISSLLIAYLIITKKLLSKKRRIPPSLKRTISEVDRYNDRNQRPLPSLPYHVSIPQTETDQYIPMNVSRHSSCSSSSTQQSFGAYKQGIKKDWMTHGQDPDNISSPLNEQPYVKIESVSFQCNT